MRSCDGCSLCCYLPQIDAVDKEPNVWCKHCTRTSCSIYEKRPQQCRDYFCGWMLVPQVPDHWQPKHCRMTLTMSEDEDGPTIIIQVDPDHPNRWRGFPYYRDIKRWAIVATNRNPRGYVHVFCAEKHWWILPDRDIFNPKPGVVTPRADGSLDYFETGSKQLADAAAEYINNGRFI